MNININQVMKDRDTVLRRSDALQRAVEEYDASVKALVKAAEVKSKSIRISKTVMARLLGLSRAHLYKMPGVDIARCNTYEDLHIQVKKNRPDLLNDLEKNYELFLNQLKRNGKSKSKKKLCL